MKYRKSPVLQLRFLHVLHVLQFMCSTSEVKLSRVTMTGFFATYSKNSETNNGLIRF